LICASKFLPRALGVLLGIGGMCYLFNSVVYFTPPGTLPDFFPYSYLPSLVAGVSLALWLLIVGVDTAKWRAESTLSVARA